MGVINELRRHQLKLDYLEVINPKIFKLEVNQAEITDNRAIVNKILGEYEARFSADPSLVYVLGGEKPTLVDFVLAWSLIATAFVNYDYASDFPNLAKYYTNLSTAYPLFKEE